MSARFSNGETPFALERHLTHLPRPLAFVFSGGAASGATQVGMLRALTQAGVRPDIVVGTSVGAINGAIAAAHPDMAAGHLARVWGRITREEITGSSSLRCLPRLVRTRRHMFPAKALSSLIRTNLPVAQFSSLPVRFAAMATHVASGQAAMLSEGCLESALLASSAIPGLFPRVQVDGEWYFDGGVTANVPLRQAFQLGAASVVVLNAAPADRARELPSNIAETIHYVANLLMRNQSSGMVRESDRYRVIELPRTSPHGLGVFDFSRTSELIERAYEATSAMLAGRAQTGRSVAGVMRQLAHGDPLSVETKSPVVSQVSGHRSLV